MDLNKDGCPDILSGSYSRNGGGFMAGLFQVLWGTKDGKFKKAEALKGTDGKPLTLPLEGASDENTPRICTRPFAVDWDSDGDLDIVSGNFAGTLVVFSGDGDGKFGPKGSMLREADGKEPLRVKGMHSDPFVVDMDGDGDLDIVSGSGMGGVQLALNTAGKGKPPAFEGFEELLPATGRFEGHWFKPGEGPEGPASSTRVWVHDLNEDGKYDLLIGDLVTLKYPAKGLTEDEAVKKEEAWLKEMTDLQEKVQAAAGESGDEPPAELMEKLEERWSERVEFAVDERTGFVWACLQK